MNEQPKCECCGRFIGLKQGYVTWTPPPAWGKEPEQLFMCMPCVKSTDRVLQTANGYLPPQIVAAQGMT